MVQKKSINKFICIAMKKGNKNTSENIFINVIKTLQKKKKKKIN